MKKKFIYIFIIIIIAILSFFSCRACVKTKALTGDEIGLRTWYYVKGQTAGIDNGFIIVYDGNYVNQKDLFSLRVTDTNNNVLSHYGFYLSGSSNAWAITMYNRLTLTQTAVSPSFSKDKPIYVQLCYDYVDEALYLYLAQIEINITRTGQNTTISTSLSSTQWLLDLTNLDPNFYYGYLDNFYAMSYMLSWGSQSDSLRALKLHYRYQILNYFSQYWDEQVEGAFAAIDDYLNTGLYVDIYNNGYNAGYTTGYNAGYQEGWDDGYAQAYSDYYMPRYNQGYNAGYEAGINDNQAAYDRGFDEGYADGWREGRLYGLSEGYDQGYSDGLDVGLAGATPMSQATTLIGSIFSSVGSVLAIQLFPGFSIGMLILVPLFFSVLGLILWIWRRN